MVIVVVMAVFKAHLVLLLEEPNGLVNQKTTDGQYHRGDAGALNHFTPALRRNVLERIEKRAGGRQPGDDDEKQNPAPRAPLFQGRRAGGVALIELALEQHTAKEP